MFIPDPIFSIPDPGLTRFRIPDPDPHQRTEVYFTRNIDTRFSKIRSGTFIRDVHSGIWVWIFFSSRIPDPEPWVKKAQDSGSRIRNTVKS
jgi:hypothetical protein